MYVGAHWAVTKELPPKQYQFDLHHGPLCQMVLVSAHHLVELMLFSCVESILKANPGSHPNHEKRYPKATFHEVFHEWPSDLIGNPFNIEVEPLKSASALHLRRNATIHKSSALASLQIAKSALFSAVEASKKIYESTTGVGQFKYQNVLDKYPIDTEQWFSEVKYLDRAPRT